MPTKSPSSRTTGLVHLHVFHPQDISSVYLVVETLFRYLDQDSHWKQTDAVQVGRGGGSESGGRAAAGDMPPV